MTVSANLMQRALAPHRDDPVEEAQRGRRRQYLDARLADPGRQLARVAGALAGEQRPTKLRAVVDEDHVRSELRRAKGRCHPRDAAADHENVGAAAAVLGAPLALGLAPTEPAEACRVAQHLLVQRPQPPRPDEGLVVEAGRGQTLAEDVGAPHEVEAQRWAGVHVLDLHPLAHRLGAGPDAGPAVDLDEAVRALPRAAEQATGAVVLEAAREHAESAGVKGRANRVPLERLHRVAIEAELEPPLAVDSVTGLGGQAAHNPGRPTQCTSLVVVSRSARNHARHPDR